MNIHALVLAAHFAFVLCVSVVVFHLHCTKVLLNEISKAIDAVVCSRRAVVVLVVT